MTLTEIHRAHFVGVGGIGMSGLARLFLHEGKSVSGSDRVHTDITTTLSNEGVLMYGGQEGDNITPDIDLVIYTEAMPKDAPELERARALNIPQMNYFQALGMVANEYYLVAVAGSHGKTTTTAMLMDIFEDAGLDPSGIVGSLRAKTKSNYRAGKSKYFIVEACEYKRDFLTLDPDMLVITNIEYEHVDYYKNLEDVQRAFNEIARKVPHEGVVVVDFGGANIAPILEGVTARIVDYGTYIRPLRELPVPGIHNQMNAAAAIAAAATLGISIERAEDTLSHFAGTWRRFEYKGETAEGAKVYDDYGHHPTEIIATIRGVRELFPQKKLAVVFQSHTYSRTHMLFDAFVHALSYADFVYLLPIYAAREENEFGVSHTKIGDALSAKGVHAYVCDDVDNAVLMLRKHNTNYDVVVAMGAGDMTSLVAQKLVQC